jgi:hypothetical protein
MNFDLAEERSLSGKRWKSYSDSRLSTRQYSQIEQKNRDGEEEPEVQAKSFPLR